MDKKPILAATADLENPVLAEAVGAIFDPHFAVELATTPALMNEVHELRYQVYCMERPFEDPNCFPNRRECDEYDVRSVHALIRHRATGECAATVRLVLSDEDAADASFPMEEPCRHAFGEQAERTLRTTPRRRIAEISRFAVSRDFRRRCGEAGTTSGVNDANTYSDVDVSGQRAMPYITLGLFVAVNRLSIEHGVTHWMAVMEPTLLRLLKRYGISFDHVGPVVDYHGRRQPVLAEAATLIDRIGGPRPDVWNFITKGGTYLPLKPISNTPAAFRAAHHGSARSDASASRSMRSSNVSYSLLRGRAAAVAPPRRCSF